jgi:hypothetical protein
MVPSQFWIIRVTRFGGALELEEQTTFEEGAEWVHPEPEQEHEHEHEQHEGVSSTAAVHESITVGTLDWSAALSTATRSRPSRACTRTLAHRRAMRRPWPCRLRRRGECGARAATAHTGVEGQLPPQR